MEKLYVHYGCSNTAPEGWINFDASPSLFIQKIPVFGKLYNKNGWRFPDNVRYGNIVKGLPVADGSVTGLFASHVLEHLSLEDCRQALRNSFRMMALGGRFRLVVPDLYIRARQYLDSSGPEAAHAFVRATGLGRVEKLSGLGPRLARAFGNSMHLWLWDEASMTAALRECGFTAIRRCTIGDSGDPMFDRVEDKNRFTVDGFPELAMEALK